MEIGLTWQKNETSIQQKIRNNIEVISFIAFILKFKENCESELVDGKERWRVEVNNRICMFAGGHKI